MAASPPPRTESMASTSSAGSAAGTAAAPSSTVQSLPTEEALQILLSPDGYYTYLAISKPSPDAYGLKYQETMSAGMASASSSSADSIVDLDQVKKNYRRLSLKHHPDRKTGDAEAFRMLNRAKIVLSSPKLRREYDLIGLDLDDDAEEENGHHHGDSSDSKNDEKSGEEGEAHDEDEKDKNSSKTETVMGHLASVTLAAVLQVVVRTALMGLVSSLISRYTILTFLAIGLLTFLTTRMYSSLKKQLGPNVTLTPLILKDVLSPLPIAFGIYCMYRGRRYVEEVYTSPTSGVADNAVAGDSTTQEVEVAEISETYLDWSYTYWLGESIVLAIIITRTFEGALTRTLLALFSIISLLLTLWLRGRFWRYLTILGFEGIIALLVVLAFPIMEMILESIVEEKMRKVGDKVRVHDERMKEVLRRKKERDEKAAATGGTQ